jgi:Predicted methyltransferase regulatory domain/Methyltransferase domain
MSRLLGMRSMNWTSGYVADIGYTADFYRETAPSHMAFAALTIGRSPGRALHPKRMLELGSGQGFGLSLLAAANPDIAFEGYDFNPEHVANTSRLIEGAALANVTVLEIGFEEAAANGGDNDLDVIALHGIFSWVARPVQDAIVAITRQRLQPNGLAYISYNCMPGWAPLAPIRQVMVEVKRRNPGRSERQLALALDLITKLRRGNAAYFAANPAAGQHLDAMLKLDHVYLAHEYLDGHWDLFQFSEVAARMSEAKLSYLASATIPENLDQYAVPENLQPLLAQTDDPMLKETIRDFAANKRFRRDLFARGSATLIGGEHRRILSELSFTLAVPRSRVMFRFAGPLMELTGRAELYLPIVNLLAQKDTSFDELSALPSFGEGKIGILLDCLALLVHSGQILPIIGPVAVDAEPARRFNRMIIGHARTGRIYRHLASPVARTGIPVTDFGLLALTAVIDGKDELPAVARHAMSILHMLGQRPMRDGVLIKDDGEAATFLAEQIKPILEDDIPLWRRLGVL